MWYSICEMPLILAAFIISLALQPATAPKPQGVSKSDSAHVTDNAKPAQSSDNKANPPPKTLPIGSSTQTKNNDESTNKSNQEIKIEWDLVELTGMLVLVGFLTAGFICWQSWETRRAAKAARDNLEFLINKERATIFVEPYEFTDLENSNYGVKYKVFCSGTTPATILESRVVAEISATKERVNPTFGLMLLPNNFIPGILELVAPLVGENEYLRNAPDERIERGELFVNFWGYVRYRDQFFKEGGFWLRKFWYIWDPERGQFVKSGAYRDNSESKKPPYRPNQS